MVLAYLWAHLREDAPQANHEYQAFVIDHNLSQKTGEVAARTKRRLIDLAQKQGAKFHISNLQYPTLTNLVEKASEPIIATLSWPRGHGHPASRPDFETAARMLRYRKLATESWANDIDTLLVGHHADDVAETVLARLAKGHKGSGLASIEPHKQVPECRGMFGIYQSGGFVRDDIKDSSRHYVGGPENGGLSIQRPLLDFPKERLVATSKQRRIKFDEDVTNADETLTDRNAIRKLLRDDVLPMALRRQSLLNLARTQREARDKKDRLAQELYEACEVRFDLRSACLKVKPPNPITVFGEDWERWTEPQRSDIVGRFIRSVADAVVKQHGKPGNLQPNQYYNLFKAFVPHSFRDKSSLSAGDPIDISQSGRKEQGTVEAGGVLFSKHPSRDNDEANNVEWVISRRPYSLHDTPPPIQYTSKAPSADNRQYGVSQPEPSKVQLAKGFCYWDGRFWISLRNENPRTVFLVTLSKTIYERFIRSLSKEHRKSLTDMLKHVAPGYIRFTLPAIVTVDESVETKLKKVLSVPEKAKMHASEKRESFGYVDDNASVIAIPTVGYIADGWEDKLSWDIRHKKLGLSGLKKMERPGEDPHPYILSKKHT